jgi:hypothetical protein
MAGRVERSETWIGDESGAGAAWFVVAAGLHPAIRTMQAMNRIVDLFKYSLRRIDLRFEFSESLLLILLFK